MDELLKVVTIIQKTVYMGVAITATFVLLDLGLAVDKVISRGLLLGHVKVEAYQKYKENDIPNVFKPKEHNKKSSPKPRDRRHY